jgi:vacuolar-type H+-ATPase subunit E/Vma4
MSGLDNILSKIIADAEAVGEREMAAAREKSAAILLESKVLAKAESEKKIAKAKSEARHMVESRISSGKLQSKRQLLLERNRIIDQALVDVRTRIVNLPDADYFRMLTTFVKAHAQNTPGTLVLNKRDLTRLPAGFAASLSPDAKSSPILVSDTPGDFDAGCVLIYGEVEYNGTVDALLYEKRDELRDLLNKELFSK